MAQKHIVCRLDEIMRAQGLTQQELARLSHVPERSKPIAEVKCSRRGARAFAQRA